MAKSSRGSLTSLSAMLSPKAGPPATPSFVPDEAPAAAAPAPQEAPDFKTMMCRVNRAGWREMSRLALDLDANLEDLLIEACNDLLRKHDRPPVVEKRSPPPRK